MYSSIAALISYTHHWKMRTEYITEARNLGSPRTMLGSSPTSVSKTSSNDGAGSTEQISTARLDFCREWKPRAAEIVVLPTPPLPTISDSGVSRAGHSDLSR